VGWELSDYPSRYSPLATRQPARDEEEDQDLKKTKTTKEKEKVGGESKKSRPLISLHITPEEDRQRHPHGHFPLFFNIVCHEAPAMA